MPKNNELVSTFNIICLLDVIFKEACYWTKGRIYSCQTSNFNMFLVESNFGNTELIGKNCFLEDFFAHFEANYKIESLPFAMTFLSDKVKDEIYRSELKQHTAEDVRARIEDTSVKLDECQIENVAHRYAYEGDYDCNLSYWDNIDNLIEVEDFNRLVNPQMHVEEPSEDEIEPPIEGLDNIGPMPSKKVTIAIFGDRVTYIKPTDFRRQSSLWYGGDIARIALTGNPTKFDPIKYLTIRAEGDVDVKIYEGENCILSVCDKGDNGAFGNELLAYIHDDDELNLLLHDKHPKYKAEIISHNWWEAMTLVDGQQIDLGVVMGHDNLADVIQAVLDNETLYAP